MDVAGIQRAVQRLPAWKRKKLTAWMVAEYPALSVERLMARAAKSEAPPPAPPAPDNIPRGRTLKHALAVADRLGLRK